MNAVRWNALRELEGMTERLNRLLARPDTEDATGRDEVVTADWFPSVDIMETADAYEIVAEVPEVDKEDIRIAFEDGVLTLQGERKQPQEDDGLKIHRMERPYGRFMRSFTLPDTADVTRATAACKDGLLHVHLPKVETAKPKTVEVKEAA